MKIFGLIFVSALVFIASFYALTYLFFGSYFNTQGQEVLGRVLGIISALGIAVFTFFKLKNQASGAFTYSIIGGIIFGSIGFIMGFFGPILLNPVANQLPLLGIFVGGPLGFLIGLYVGRRYWLRLDKNKTH